MAGWSLSVCRSRRHRRRCRPTSQPLGISMVFQKKVDAHEKDSPYRISNEKKKWFLEWPELTKRRNGNIPSCVECYEAIFRCVKHLCLMSPGTDFSPSLINYSRHRLANMRERCDLNWQEKNGKRPQSFNSITSKLSDEVMWIWIRQRTQTVAARKWHKKMKMFRWHASSHLKIISKAVHVVVMMEKCMLDHMQPPYASYPNEEDCCFHLWLNR